jgi:uncharacterized protein involved in copper resistance
MSAISLPSKVETSGLVDAIGRYVEADALLDLIQHLEKASAKIILDKLDVVMEPGDDRAAIRRRILDTLAWYRTEINRWVESSSGEAEKPKST